MLAHKFIKRFNYPYLNHMAHSGATVGFFSGLTMDPFGYRSSYKKVNGELYTKKVDKKDWLASCSVPAFLGYLIGTYYPLTFPVIGSYLIVKTHQWNHLDDSLVGKESIDVTDVKTIGGNDI